MIKVFLNGVFANWKIESDLFRTSAGVWPVVMVSQGAEIKIVS